MMIGSLTSQSVLYLSVCFVVGFGIAWHIRGVLLNRRFAEFSRAWEAKLREKNAQLATAHTDVNVRVSRIRALEAELSAEVAEQSRLVSRLRELQQKMEKSSEVESLLRDAEAQKEMAQNEAARLRHQLKNLEPLTHLLAIRNQRIRELESRVAPKEKDTEYETLHREKNQEIDLLKERINMLESAEKIVQHSVA
ncbi:MAG: hypothetical protein HY961_21665 [Ignavibacteriae bacterium]|nr:hypothetical protein [Ignavibacteriota bacterium]